MSTLTVLLLAAVAFVQPAWAADEEYDDPLRHLQWRNIGPVNMSGRVADVEGVPGNPKVVYVGSASGGVWRTVNGGVTFEPIFDDQPTASIGDLALAPSNPGVIYVGSGEGNPRNSVSFGNGVYKSTDGGDTWTHLGLEQTRHITRIVVDSLDAEHVCVGALGNIFGPNEERGVFCSWDGGASWEKTLYLDEEHGVSDMDIDPSNPNIVYAAMWRFERKPWTHWSGSEDGGVYRSVDGGRTWKKLEDGLPKLLGRIGVKVAPSKPEVVYVIAESNEGVLFRSENRGNEFTKVSDNVRIVSRGLYYTDMRVSPVDEDEVFAVSSRLFRSKDGGKTFERISRSTHVDYHSLWIDPENPDRIWQGQDGGVAVSYDGGKTWDPIRNLPLAQFYQVFTDNREPFYVVGGGLQDNGTWYGPSRTRDGSILADHWWMMSFGDAYFVVPHPDIEDLYLSEYQGGGIMRTNTRTGQQVEVNPQTRRNDGGPVGELEYRFNWNAPIVLSPHDSSTVYFAGNVVFKTTDFGDTWEQISPDLTTNDPEKQGEAGGPVWYENTTAEYHCTIISFAESPVEAGVLWAGTDDGKVQLSRDHGETWTDLTGSLIGVPGSSPVSHIEPSTTAGGTAYATFDRHMFADFAPHVFKTTDYGATWRRLAGIGLPEEGWIWVLKEDPKNPDLLYAGTEVGLYASHDAGSSWSRLHLENLPTVAIHDLIIHPRTNDIVLGTHGRAIWIFDDATPLQQLEETDDKAVHLFPVRPALRYARRFSRYGLGDRQFRGPNPPYGAAITYYLAESLEEQPTAGSEESQGEEAEETVEGEAEPRLKIEILAGRGDEVLQELEELALEAGMHRVHWDLTGQPPRTRRDREGGGEEFFGGPSGPVVPPGTYRVRLTVDGASLEQPIEVRLDPKLEVSNRDLRAQYEMANRLRDLQSVANDAMRRLDVIKDEMASRKASIERLKQELPEEVSDARKELGEALTELLEQMARPEGKTFWSQSPRLSDQLGSLFGNVNGGFAAPTAAHRAYYDELEEKCAEAFAAMNVFFSETIPALNERLVEQSLPTLTVPEPLEWEAAEEDDG